MTESELLGPVQESHQSLEGANSEFNDPADLRRLQESNMIRHTQDSQIRTRGRIFNIRVLEHNISIQATCKT